MQGQFGTWDRSAARLFADLPRMTNVIDPSFLLELGAYAVAAAGIRLLKHRISRTRQQVGHDLPLENSRVSLSGHT